MDETGVLGLLEELSILLEDSKTVFGKSNMRQVDISAAFEIMDEIRDIFPGEFAQARQIVRERQALLEDAEDEANRLIEDARSQAMTIASEQEIVRISQQQAETIMADARELERETRAGAEDYADEVFGDLGDTYRRVILYNLISSVVDGCLYDEFQAEVYENPEMELEEINRILRELSAEAGEFAGSIIESYRYAVELNLIFAKAQVAYRMKAVTPKLTEDGVTVLHAARHPLIDKEKVVPTDISLGRDFDSLIITGPNTGGKTVALKTVGLLTLMAMCGLMIPAAEGSQVSVFAHILADIGDEQSIEQSLSTFSAHMTNIISTLSVADGRSLVLLDELGAGTDPVEGAALATAIIEELRSMGVRLACTTHYAELKAYALQTPGVENGCCEFDVQSLRPTYRLLIGVPGKSNAFAISRRLGLEGRIVDRAGELISRENSVFEQVVGRLEEDRRKLEDELAVARRAADKARESVREAQAKQAEANSQARRELEQARKEAELIVQKTRRQADALLNELDEARRSQNKALSAEQKARLRSGMRDLENAADPVHKQRGQEDYRLPRDLKPGDSVLIYDIDKKATVLEEARDGQVLVQAGIIKTRVPVENLRLLGEQRPEKPKGRSVTKSVSAPDASSSLDLRGMNSDEALMEVDAFLDRAARMNLQLVTIIHGKGTGVLRAAVQQHLRRCPQVKKFRLGAFGEGESGVTVVEMK